MSKMLEKARKYEDEHASNPVIKIKINVKQFAIIHKYIMRDDDSKENF